MKDKRNKVLNDFKNANTGLLLCTDVMARGIDIEEVSYFIVVIVMLMNCSKKLPQVAKFVRYSQPFAMHTVSSVLVAIFYF